MKKILIGIVVVLSMRIMTNKTYGLSSKFKFVIDTVGIPRYNAYNDEINEDVYYTYNIFSYGAPKKITKNQRWKNSKYGFWTKNGGSYKGTGTRGEYYILGKSYSGKEIYNYYFPMDVVPSTTPDKWTFYTYPEASSSWKDTTKYIYKEQLDYMKQAKLMFNDISSRSKADNPKYIKEYNITPNSIGLSKARLDTAATWKTYGMVSTRRLIDGVIYSQVYLVKPMAADANVESTLEVDEKYILEETQDELIIPIRYNVKVTNMTGYADKKHIKEIKAMLYIDGKKKDENSGSKIISVGNEYMLVISRDDYPPNNNYEIKISVEGYMHTEFAVDGLMQSSKTKTIAVTVEPKLIIPVKTSNLLVLEKDSNYWVVRPLAQTAYNTQDSLGFTESGKSLAIKLDLNVEKDKIKDIHIFLDNKEIKRFESYNTKNSIYALSFKIPKETKTTLLGVYSLREQTDSYFEVRNNDVGKRVKAPHNLEIKFKCYDKEYTELFLFDTLDNFLSNINSTIENTNKNMLEITKLEDWIN